MKLIQLLLLFTITFSVQLYAERYIVDTDNIPDWYAGIQPKQIDPHEAFRVRHGEYNGVPLYWNASWWPDTFDIPGSLHDSGYVSAWQLINSLSFVEEKEFQWVGWNSNAEIIKVVKNNFHKIETEPNGNTGKQLDQAGPGAYIPTWRDGSEAAYAMIHDDLGLMNFETAVEPANRVGREFPHINVGWAAVTSKLDRLECESLRGMVYEGHEIVSHSHNHKGAGAAWLWYYHGDMIPNDDSSIPKAFRGLTVDTTKTKNWEKKEFRLTFLDYHKGDYDNPDTIVVVDTYEVAHYVANEESVSGFIKGTHKGWDDNAAASVSMLKLFVHPGWEKLNSMGMNIVHSKVFLDSAIYEKVNSLYFPESKRCEFISFPQNQYSTQLHDSLELYGYIGATGDKSGTPTMSDFYYPYNISSDELFPLNGEASEVFPDNPFQRLGLQQLVENAIGAKGCMIRTLYGVTNVGGDTSKWQDALNDSKGGWWGGIPEYLYREHFHWLDEQYEAHKLTIMTPSELVKYRIMTNAALGAQVSYWDDGTYRVSVDMGDVPEMYQDEISVIVVLDEPLNDAYVKSRYVDHKKRAPRYQPRQLDDEGRAWSVSINPFVGDVIFGDSWIPNVLEKNSLINNLSLLQSPSQLSFHLPVGEFSVKIYTLQGKEMLANEFHNRYMNAFHAIETSSFASGVYLLEIESEGVLLHAQKVAL